MFSYFDLNARSQNATRNFATMSTTTASGAAAVPLSGLQQVFMYVGVVIGVIFSSTVNTYNQSGAVTFNLPLVQIGIACIVALIIIPQVYEKLSIQPDSPFIVQLGFFVMNGITWQVIFATATKAIGT